LRDQEGIGGFWGIKGTYMDLKGVKGISEDLVSMDYYMYINALLSHVLNVSSIQKNTLVIKFKQFH